MFLKVSPIGNGYCLLFMFWLMHNAYIAIFYTITLKTFINATTDNTTDMT